MDFSKSVIMPREDFEELATVAFNQKTSVGERSASVAQFTLFCALFVGSFAFATRFWRKEMVALEKIKYDKELTLLHAKTTGNFPTFKDE